MKQIWNKEKLSSMSSEKCPALIGPWEMWQKLKKEKKEKIKNFKLKIQNQRSR